jgi:hypothetical protein
MDLKTAKDRVEAILATPTGSDAPFYSPKIPLIRALREAYQEGYQAGVAYIEAQDAGDEADELVRHRAALLRAEARVEAWRELVSMLLNRVDGR